MNRIWIGLLTVSVGAGLLAAPEAKKPDALVTQAHDILMKHCGECHGKNPKKVKGGLNVFDPEHLFDKERGILTPKSPDDSDLFRRIEDGSMPPGDRAKVSDAERKVLKDWILAGAELPKGDPAPKRKPKDEAGLSAQAKEIFRVHCYECHGGTSTNAGIKILDHDSLIKKKKIVPGKPDDSLTFKLMVAQDDSIMPPQGQPRLNQDDIEVVRRWIAAGAAPFPADAAKPEAKDVEAALAKVAGADYVLKKILEHVRSVRMDDRRFLRFFSINHLLMKGITQDELDLHRDALAKAINHLSWERDLVRPKSIDEPTNSLFVVDIRQLGWHKQPFDRIDKNKPVKKADFNLFDLILLEYPYSTIHEDSETYDRVAEEFLVPSGQVRPIPFVRVDWFVSTITQPPLYDDLLQLPFNLADLEKQLGIDSQDNIDKAVAKRAGMVVSGVSHNNRVVERHPARHGSYWKSFDFRSSKERENILKDPIDLHPTGGEMIFTLPNGLQGYAVTDSKGDRLDAAPTEIVTDKFAEDKIVRNGLSCMRCHDQGMKTFLDNVRPAVSKLPGKGAIDKRRVMELYVEQADMDKLVKEDSERFLNAMQKLLGKPQLREPLIPVSRRFLDAPMQLQCAAGELGLVDAKNLKEAFKLPQFSALGLMPLANDGVIRRDAWEDYYDQVVRYLGVGTPIVPYDSVTRKEIVPNPVPFDVHLRTSKKNNIFEPGDKMVVFVDNKSKHDLFIELIGTSATGEKVLLADGLQHVKAGGTFRFPSTGEIAIKPKLGKEQITVFASNKKYPPGILLRGKGVTDRFVHPFYKIERDNKRLQIGNEPTTLVKKTIEIETR